MAKVSVRYPCGSKVALGPVEGTVTAIFVRNRHRSYEISFFNKDGTPQTCTAEELELTPSAAERKLGFIRS